MIVYVRISNTIDSLNKIMKCARYDNYSFTYATNVFFDSGKDVLTQNGKDLLDQFIPLCLSILMKDEFSPFLNNLCVEVHSGTIGSSDSNLKLTQQRAEAIVSYCQTMDSLSEDQLEFLKEYLTGVGYGSEKPVLNEDSTVDEEASPRIVFSLDLKSL